MRLQCGDLAPPQPGAVRDDHEQFIGAPHEAGVEQTGDPASCSFKVTGSVDASFNEGSQSLGVTPPTAGAKLTISNVVGCYGLLADGDQADYTGSYAISTSAGSINIS